MSELSQRIKLKCYLCKLAIKDKNHPVCKECYVGRKQDYLKQTESLKNQYQEDINIEKCEGYLKRVMVEDTDVARLCMRNSLRAQLNKFVEQQQSDLISYQMIKESLIERREVLLNTLEKFEKQVNIMEGQLKLKQKELTQRRNQQLVKQQIDFASLPILHDCLHQYKYFSFGKDEVQEIRFFMDVQFITDENVEFLDYPLKLRTTLLNNWQEMSRSHLFNLTLGLKMIFSLLYYVQQIFQIELPYPLYMDEEGFTQSTVFKLFVKERGNQMIFQEIYLSQMQLNTYYLLYSMGWNLDITFQRKDNFFNLIEVITICKSKLKIDNNPKYAMFNSLLDEYVEKDVLSSDPIRLKFIPMKLATHNVNKFQLEQSQSITQEDDDDFIIIS